MWKAEQVTVSYRGGDYYIVLKKEGHLKAGIRAKKEGKDIKIFWTIFCMKLKLEQ